ncbi:MAG: Lipid A biosynthesis lauroyl acyltransferase [Syntrophus sp. PtaB.Bin075]|nr:MAG: Lipid A biosynthesis lauroyl acyltransferase [Syntrophus sp. PtaB.Bin075]
MKKLQSHTVVLLILKSIPLSVRRFLFTGIALLVYCLVPKRRLIALYNLHRAFPEKSMDEVVRIAKGVYRNVGILAAEFVDIPSLNASRINEFMEVRGLENYWKAKAKNKGVVLVTAHFGNWELMAAAFAVIGEPIMILYRPFDNPLLENIVSTVRTSTGNTVTPANRAMRGILRCLRDKKTVGLLIDQNVSPPEGRFVQFFNRPACTSPGLAHIALLTEAPVLPAFLIRKEDGKYILQVGAEIEWIKSGDDDRDIILNTQRYTRAIEDVVRQHPEQWFWVHHRWKAQPLPHQ